MSLLIWNDEVITEYQRYLRTYKTSIQCKAPFSITAYNSQCLIYDEKKRHLFAPPLSLCKFAKQSQKASFTIEASVVLPLCICALVFVMIFFRILSIQWGINSGGTDIARTAAVYGSNLDGGIGKTGVIALSYENLSSKDVPVKFIYNGSVGVSFIDSKIDDTDVDIVAKYIVQVPTMLFGKKSFFIGQRVKARRWVGYDPVKEREEDGEYVYITRTGTAYHKDIGCTYLSPSLRASTITDVANERNKGGAKYYPCSRCSKADEVMIYITDYGTIYHSDPKCGFISRSVTRVRIRDLENHHGCHKCT